METWLADVAELNDVSAHDYFKGRGMPSFIEPLISRLVEALVASPSGLSQEQWAQVSRTAGDKFGWYARKLSGRAVRERSRIDLRNGLLAAGIAAHGGDVRDVVPLVALLFNSAERLGEDLNELVRGAAAKSPTEGAAMLREFLKRPRESRGVAVFGFREGVGPAGFEYLPLMIEDGGPSPI
jgi:hypothetical protein